MLSFVLKSLVVMHHFRAVWMISLCHMLIQKKIIIISSVTEILHINVIQCQLILMKHLGSFLRLTILIDSILDLGYCISSPLWLYSTSVISSCTIWLNGNCCFLFHSSIYLFIFSPHGGEKRWRQKMKYKLEINCKIYVFPILRFGNWWTCHKGQKGKKWMAD